jgi:hypothetical protein
MIEIFAEGLGPVLVTDSVAKFDLLASVPGRNGEAELQPACRIIIPITEIENIVGRLHERLRGHLKRLDVAVAASADGAAERVGGAPAPAAAAKEATTKAATTQAATIQAATQSVVVLTVPKPRT